MSPICWHWSYQSNVHRQLVCSWSKCFQGTVRDPHITSRRPVHQPLGPNLNRKPLLEPDRNHRTALRMKATRPCRDCCVHLRSVPQPPVVPLSLSDYHDCLSSITLSILSTSFVSNGMRHCQLHTAIPVLWSSVLSSCNIRTITKYCVYILYILCAECLFLYNCYYTEHLEDLNFLFFSLSLHHFSCRTVCTSVTKISLPIAHCYMKPCLSCHLVADLRRVGKSSWYFSTGANITDLLYLKWIH